MGGLGPYPRSRLQWTCQTANMWKWCTLAFDICGACPRCFLGLRASFGGGSKWSWTPFVSDDSPRVLYGYRVPMVPLIPVPVTHYLSSSPFILTYPHLSKFSLPLFPVPLPTHTHLPPLWQPPHHPVIRSNHFLHPSTKEFRSLCRFTRTCQRRSRNVPERSRGPVPIPLMDQLHLPG